ncbi:unnamed protein product [Tilletia laevis]|uniref:Uncharacterized protein n=2 Tax=Tilletia TaxID=13289 RepID=A0A9N8LML3_9BASI|nr:unnamed protein product [Tilletia caries]CAD6903758.1 unnamed protein product [Tilletia laevis]CAD6898355.1 unnamed protein product [Tilletia caries]CAD6918568.1 unnamed protein product [Tilletia laevis]CAD6938606.1 unnamed protein product [Tilletia caries]
MASGSRGSSPAVRAIQDRHDKIRSLFVENFPLLQTIRARALSELVPSLTASLKLQEEGAKRAKFHEENTLQALRETLQWRITSEVDNLDVDELHPLYVDPPSVARALRDAGDPSASPKTTDSIESRPPLFWINDRLKDHYGRPCGVISLRTLERTEERNLENIKEYILASVEIGRRHIAEMYARSDFIPDSVAGTPLNSPTLDQRGFQKGDASSAARPGAGAEVDKDDLTSQPRSGPLQMVLACDLDGAGMSNLEIELLPFLLDLLKKHYPGHIAVMYLLHYGWVHAGMWTLAKRVLPQVVLDKIIFPKDDGTPLEEGGQRGQIEDHFDRRRWPRALGKCGAWTVSLDAAHNSVMRRFSSSVTKRPRSHSQSRHSSRSSSFVNLHQLGAFTPMDEKGNALGPWAAPDGRATPGSSAGLGIVGAGVAGGPLAGGDWGQGWAGGSANPPIRRRWRDLFRTLTYLFVLRILTLNRRMRRRVVDMGRVVGRSLVAGGQNEADDQPERWSRHGAFAEGGNSGKFSNARGGQRRTGTHARLPQLQMSSNRLSPQVPSSPTFSPGGRSPTSRANVRYPTGWGQLGPSLRRDGSVAGGSRDGGNNNQSGYSRRNTLAVWRSGMRHLRSFTLFALIVALFQSDWRTGLPKGPGMATVWDSVRAVAILGVGQAALRSSA